VTGAASGQLSHAGAGAAHEPRRRPRGVRDAARRGGGAETWTRSALATRRVTLSGPRLERGCCLPPTSTSFTRPTLAPHLTTSHDRTSRRLRAAASAAVPAHSARTDASPPAVLLCALPPGAAASGVRSPGAPAAITALAVPSAAMPALARAPRLQSASGSEFSFPASDDDESVRRVWLGARVRHLADVLSLDSSSTRSCRRPSASWSRCAPRSGGAPSVHQRRPAR
jgi:hypothetical protein